MFFRQISDFDENFKFLDRLNALLFNVWRDNNAEAYRTQSMEQLEMFYRNYVNEMRQKSNEMKALEREINDLIEKLRLVGQDTRQLTIDPEIEGCTLCTAYGHERGIGDMTTTESFIMRPGEDPHFVEEYAMERCRELADIQEAYCGNRL